MPVFFVQHCRIYRCFKSDLFSQNENTALFQSDINRLNTWSETWDLKFNTSKCCIFHFGRPNIKSPYKIKDMLLQNKHQEKDLGILFTDNFKFNDHMNMTIKKANRQLCTIARVLKHKNPKIIVLLYKSFVRPFLEYNSIIWSPYTNTYVQKFEKIQEKMCNLMNGMRSLSYQQKLAKLRLQSLQTRRIRYQLCFMFEMKHRLNFALKISFKKTRTEELEVGLISTNLFFLRQEQNTVKTFSFAQL